MTPRQRVLTALRHEEPDRVPLFYRDVPEVNDRLLRDLSLPDRDALLGYLDIDFRWVGPRYVGPDLEDEPTGHVHDIWGVEYEYIPMDGGGRYLHAVCHPLVDVTDPAVLDDYPWPRLDWFDFTTLPGQVARYDNYAIMTAPGDASPGVLTTMQSLLGEERAWTDMIVNPTFFRALADRILAFEMPFIDALFTAAGGRIDFFRIGDDYGTQQGLLVGPALWRAFLRPGLEAMAAVARRHGAFYYHHSCGSVRELIPSLIDLGVDVLDPVQVGARGMVPAELKREFGHRLSFSGGVDEQQLLNHGSPDEVRAGVRSLLDDMGHGGGFFLGPTHNLQCDIPTENVVAMYESACQWRY